MKFLIDMGISPKSSAFLKSLGYDTQHVQEVGFNRSSDEAILAKARKEGRIVLTHDLDFGEIVAAGKSALPSVVIFRLRNMRPERVNRYLLEVIKRLEQPLLNGVIISVTEGLIRSRALPIET